MERSRQESYLLKHFGYVVRIYFIPMHDEENLSGSYCHAGDIMIRNNGISI
jgi:hypothetical protein